MGNTTELINRMDEDEEEDNKLFESINDTKSVELQNIKDSGKCASPPLPYKGSDVFDRVM